MSLERTPALRGARIRCLFVTAALAATSVVGACTTIAEKTISDQALAQAASRVFGVAPGLLRIADRDHTAIQTYFTVITPDGKRHKCEIDAGAFSVGTMFTNGARCDGQRGSNPLLEAAGRQR